MSCCGRLLFVDLSVPSAVGRLLADAGVEVATYRPMRTSSMSGRVFLAGRGHQRGIRERLAVCNRSNAFSSK
jgi:hypothetical protein